MHARIRANRAQVRGTGRMARGARATLAVLLLAITFAPGTPRAQVSIKTPVQTTKPPLSVPPGSVKPVRPDLAIDHVTVDSSCNVVVTVVNRGPGTVPDSVWTEKTPSSSSVYLTANNKPWGGRTIWSFDTARRLQKAGGVASLTLNYKVSGTVTAKVTVDHTAQVAEADENNNTFATSLTCGGPTNTVQRSNVAPASASATVPPSEPPPETGFAGAPGDAEPAGQAPLPPSAGGSLLQSQLPPPPTDTPPPPQREDRSVEPAEIVVASSNMAEAQALAQTARGLGFGVKRRSNLNGLGLVVTVLRVPRDTSVGSALAALRQAAPSVWADANHRYSLEGDSTAAFGRRLIGWEQASPYCGRNVRIGMLDTAIVREHPALKGRDIVTRSVLAAGIPRARPDHGTAIAALLVGNTLPSGFGGLVPAARLYAAEVFRARGDEADTTAEWIVAALDWLATQKVAIVNLSLGGARNLLVEAAVARLLELGIAVVAAGGNRGPDAPPVYPAAQRGVVAVTAVDAELKPYKKASRGDYIAFAAPGVDVWSAAPGGDGRYYSGTSYAAPYVTAALVARRQAQPRAAWPALLERAQAEARDLGDRGKDPVYGWGLVQAPACGQATASAR